jgi:glucose/arabinose dehydrogenase/PKD repeat protein
MRRPTPARSRRRAAVLAAILAVSSLGSPWAPAVSAQDPIGTSAGSAGPEVLRVSPEAEVGVESSTLGGFTDTAVLSGLVNPMAIQFASDGRVFVAEKSGIIKVYASLTAAPTTFVDLRTNVHNFWDRGMLGLALDPGFTSGRPYVYVLYAYNHILGEDPGAVPKWPDSCPNPPGSNTDGCVVSARLSRLTSVGGVAVGGETVLIEDWCQQFPSHSVGTIVFGTDGALYASGGDGASFTASDWGQFGATNPGGLANPCGDPPGPIGTAGTPPTAEGGALRSQDLRTTGDPTGMNGTIIRIDPDTGAGLPTNPLAASSDVAARRIVATGLRNPFRITTRPGTSEIWVGDVGWNIWEEVNRITSPTAAVTNFGWPCYEGSGRQSGYDAANLTICENLYATPSAVTAPYYAYRHSDHVVANDACPTGSSAIAGMAFYPESGGTYPATFQGGLFFADHSRFCIYFMPKGTNGNPDPNQRLVFVEAAAGPVDLKIGPAGDLFYVDYDGGTIHRITWAPGNGNPTASFTATPSSGTAPLAVTFNAAASSDPDGDPLTYAWDLDGDGQYDDATGPTASRTYPPGQVTVRLRVADPSGAFGTTSRLVDSGNSPPVPIIDSPAASLTWKVGDDITFAGQATDAQDGTEPASRLTWTLVMEHCPSNCHSHTIETFPGVAGGSFDAPDHEYPSHLELTLTATDANGASASTTVELQPRTVGLTFQTVPSGLEIGVGTSAEAAPFTRTVIVGSSNSISAPLQQSLGGVSYVFDSWSDGGAASHTVVAGATGATRTATYVEEVFDTTPPSATAPTWFVKSGIGLNAGRPTLRLQWSGSDAFSGLDRFEVGQSTDGGAWSTIGNQLSPTYLDRLVSQAHTYRFRVRAVDNAGNFGAWMYGPTSRITAISQASSAVRYAGTWSNATSTTIWWGGTAKASSTAGSTASYTFTGRAIAWVAVKAPTRGKAQIFINGVLKATVDLYASTVLKQHVIWQTSGGVATRTIMIKVLGTAGRPRIDVDGFIVGS